MGRLTVRFLVFFLKIGMLFIPEQKYVEKIERIKSMDEKNAGCDLEGWQYRTVRSEATGFVHRYYYYPAVSDTAPVFLFFHGLNLDGRTFLRLKGLADRWQLIAYDLPEKTDRYQGSFDDFMAIANDFVDLLEIKACCLCGVSFGGAVALRLAAAHPVLKAQRLVLISTGIVGSTEEERRRNREMGKWVDGMPDYKLYWLMEKLIERSGRGAARDTVHSVERILRIKHPQFYRQVGVSMASHDAGDDARRVTCPVLMLQGDRDEVFTPKQVARIRELMPQTEFEVVEGGTHSMVYTRGEEVAGRIRDFCTRHCDDTLGAAN